MKRMIFTWMLTIVSSVWMTNEAGNWCMPSVRTLTEPWIEVNGTFQDEGFPCEPDEICPPCLTIVLVTSDKTYYLVTDDGLLIDQLDTIPLGTKATVSGIPFAHGSYDYIQVSHIETDRTSQLPSLCDEWNVLHEPFSCDGIYCRLQTFIYRLTTDTLIQDVNYVKLMEQEGSNTYYNGAMREGPNRDIYYIPADSTHEYLLYAFNAQVGDTLSNLWVGGFGRDYQGVVQAISDSSPRLFTIRVLHPAGMGVEPGESFSVTWIEGVGSPETPYGLAVVPTVPADIGVYTLLCSYKNGEQVYSSSKSERYGCEFNGIPSTKPYSLCDTWNVLEVDGVTCGGCEEYRTMKYCLTTDTIIGSTHYVKLMKGNAYEGALREGNNRDIYYIPNGSTHEYLLYDFNAQVGDKLTNLWVGDTIKSATIIEIEPTTPRTFVLSVEYYQSGYLDTTTVAWIEGVGSLAGPTGRPGFIIPNSRAYSVLCAYKNGEQVYVSDMGEQYGCEYNYDPYAPSDTIPLFSYTGDDPGSSTVDPVDPNQVIATLKGDELTIRDNSGEEIMMALSLSEGEASVPGFNRVQRTQSFRNELTVSLTEEGLYRLELSNPSWEYTIYGTFRYPQQHDAIDHTLAVPAAQKILRNGQLLIRIGDKVYTVHGTEVGE